MSAAHLIKSSGVNRKKLLSAYGGAVVRPESAHGGDEKTADQILEEKNAEVRHEFEITEMGESLVNPGAHVSTKRVVPVGGLSKKRKKDPSAMATESPAPVDTEEASETKKDNVAVVPPLRARSKTLANGQLRPPGIVFAATYDNASAIGKALSKMDTFTSDYNMVFNADGLDISFMDRSHVQMIAMHVPRTSFIRYENLGKALDFPVAASSVNQFGRLCSDIYTLTFSYDQCPNSNEPLQLMLYPADGDRLSAQIVYRSIETKHLEIDSVASIELAQYEVEMSAKQFYKNVVSLGIDKGPIRLRLKKEGFEMTSETVSGLIIQTFDVPTADVVSGAACTIKRVGDPAAPFKLEQFGGFLFAAKFLEGVSTFCALCKTVRIRFGLVKDTGDGSIAEAPLHLVYPVRSDERGPFDINVWLALINPSPA